ncbi:MAG: two pore domain potassium channel family protein [Bacteroides sp.]|nr:two pore domain potassium channel family protein [Bacteroides sp.]
MATTNAPTNPSTPPQESKAERVVTTFMNIVVLILSAALISWISYDTFKRTNFLENHSYMTFQFWVCMVFILDFFVGLYYAQGKWSYFKRRLLFLILSIPVLNIVNMLNITLSPDMLYFARFIPLARGALALAIVVSYVSSNAVTSLFASYITIMLFIAYFCSLIFFQREAGVNPEVNTYWTALWWTMMNLSTVGCSISPVTVAGKIVAVILPISGMIIFPLFTVYLTDYVTRSFKKNTSAQGAPTSESSDSAGNA